LEKQMAGIESTVQPGAVCQKNASPRGDLLEDRIRGGLTGCVAEQTAIALQIARALQQLHRQGKYHGRIRSGLIFLDEHDQIALAGEPGSDESLQSADVRGFGLVLFELLSGNILEESECLSVPDVEPLYKAGITPRLVEIVRQCTSEENRPRDLSSCPKELEGLLRQMLGEAPAAVDRKKMLAIVSVALAVTAAIAWAMLH
jgi:serine/threonine protein kinase